MNRHQDPGHAPEFEVSLSRSLYRRLRLEARRLEIPFEWLVASLVADTFDEAGVAVAEPAAA